MSTVEPARQHDERNEHLRDAVSSLRVSGGRRNVERWLMIVGAALIGIGLPLILLGWWGAARTPYVFEQIPYLISGGVFGLALAVVGGLCYFAYWMTRQVDETRRSSIETHAVLRRIEGLLASDGDGRDPPGTVGSFVMTSTGTMFHRPDCVVVAGRTGVRPVPPGGETGLEPCRICDPAEAGGIEGTLLGEGPHRS